MEKVQTKSLINYKPDDQVKPVWKIAELVAFEPPIAVLFGLIASFNTVTNFRRQREEILNSFVARRCRLAADHPLRLWLASSEANNPKLQPISLAEAIEDESQNAISIREDTLMKFEDICSELEQFPLEPPMRLPKSDSLKFLKLKIHTSRRKVELFSNALDEAIHEAKSVPTQLSSVGELLIKTSPRCCLNLDGTVIFTRNLSFNDQNDSQMYTKTEIDNIVGQKDQSAMFALSKGQGFNSQGPNSKKQGQSRCAGDQNRIKDSSDSLNRSGNKRSSSASFCYHCGYPKYLSGSSECKSPSFLTKKRRPERSSKERKKQKSNNQAEKLHHQDIEFSRGIQPYETQSCLISAGVGARSDVNTAFTDPIPIIDPGFPRSVDGITSAAALSIALGVDFKIQPLNCDPFYHGYGPECANPKLTIVIWNMPVTDLRRQKAQVPLFLVEGDDPLLLGYEILNPSNLMEEENLLVIPPGVGNLSARLVTFPPYSIEDENNIRTHLHVFPCH